MNEVFQIGDKVMVRWDVFMGNIVENAGREAVVDWIETWKGNLIYRLDFITPIHATWHDNKVYFYNDFELKHCDMQSSGEV